MLFVGNVLYYLICGGVVVVLNIFIILIFMLICAGLKVENSAFLFLKSGEGDFKGCIDGIVENF